jgi:hypothetical protein
VRQDVDETKVENEWLQPAFERLIFNTHGGTSLGNWLSNLRVPTSPITFPSYLALLTCQRVAFKAALVFRGLAGRGREMKQFKDE